MTVSLLSDRLVDSECVKGLAAASPFSNLPRTVVDQLAAASEIRNYDDGETISSIGQYDASEVLIVADGALTISFVDEASGSMVFEQLSVGEVFGLAPAVLDPSESNDFRRTLIAVGDTSVIALDAAELRSAVQDTRELSLSLLRHFAEQIVFSDASPIAAESSGERRVYAEIVDCVEVDDETGDWIVRVMPKHRELAERARVEDTVAAQAVAALIQKGVANRQYPGLLVKDIEELRRLSE